MNEQQISNIRAFIKDKDLNEAVKSALLKNFLATRSNADVHTLAAQTLAVQFLESGWREMEKYKQGVKTEVEHKQIGL